MKEIELIPIAPILIESTRSVGYSFESAIADIIDNSIGNGAKQVDVFFDSNNPPFIAILDDGIGMSKEELEQAMQYGSQSPIEERSEKDLGRFGLGLKMASLSQCRQLTVISKKNNEISAARWDLDYVLKTNKWTLIEFEKSEIENLIFYTDIAKKESGTAVVWTNFDKMILGTNNIEKTFDEKIDIAKKHIALVFHRYLSDIDGIKIFFNKKQIVPVDPFLENSPATQKLKEQSIFVEGKEIKVKPFVLPYISKMTSKDKQSIGDISDLRQNQGFYIYRNRRLIIYGTWFRLIKNQELNKLARVRVDIPNSLDSVWEIDIKKSTASLPDKIKRNLVDIVENAVGRSEKVFSYRGRKENSDASLIAPWSIVNDRGSFRYEINKEAVLYKQLEACLDDNQLRFFNSFISTVENSFPFQQAYYHMAKNNEIKQTNIVDEQLYRTFIDMLDSARNLGMNENLIIDSLDKFELFKGHDSLIEKIRKDFSHE